MIRVVVAGDVRLYREGLAHGLSSRAGILVVGTAAGADETIALVQGLRPDILLVDTAMSGALRTVECVARAAPSAKVVALALADEARVLEFAEAGVAGLVSCDGSLDDLIATIESTARGELICSPRTAAALLRRLTALAAAHDRGLGASLTPRELQILRLVDRGLANKEIAAQLGIGLATVKNHVHKILEKLHVRRRGEAAARLRTVGSHNPDGAVERRPA